MGKNRGELGFEPSLHDTIFFYNSCMIQISAKRFGRLVFNIVILYLAVSARV